MTRISRETLYQHRRADSLAVVGVVEGLRVRDEDGLEVGLHPEKILQLGVGMQQVVPVAAREVNGVDCLSASLSLGPETAACHTWRAEATPIKDVALALFRGPRGTIIVMKPPCELPSHLAVKPASKICEAEETIAFVHRLDCGPCDLA